MARERIPTHAPDTKPILVLEDDDAWDKARIESEIAELKKAERSEDDHPVRRYASGDTRYDLNAHENFGGKVVTAAEYLDETKRPWKFELRRLSPSEYDDVLSLVDRGDRRKAFSLACRLGVVAVENAGVTLKGGKGQPLHPDDVEWLHEQGLRFGIGAAVFIASQPLSAAEKKP